MKRCFLVVISFLFIAGVAFTQPGPQSPGQQPPGPQGQPTQATATIKGGLSFVNGQIAVKSAGVTYYVRGLQRLFGFVDGLKEGAEVTLEGYVSDIPVAPEYKRFLVTKLTFNGKEYALSQRQEERGFSRMPPAPPPGMYDRRHNDKRRNQ
jgi:hypothetical protein